MNNKDQKLLARLKRGEAKAVREWFILYHDELLKFVSFKVSVTKDAEEIVQETFINCLKHLPLFGGRSKLITWMKSIARHEIADYYRKKYAKKAIQTLPLSQLVLGEEIHDATETSERVKVVLSQMSVQSRELLMLKYIDKKKVAVIARDLGRTAKAIESDLFRARQEFRRLYAQIST